MEENKNKIELRTREIDTLLGHTPNWLIRYGISGIFTGILIILIGSMFFPYPEQIEGPVYITSINPPISVLSHSTGQIELLVKDKDHVEEGQWLAVMKNPADYRDVMLLDSLFMSEIPPDELDININILKIGPLTSFLNDFCRFLNDYHLFTELNYIPQRIEASKKQLEYLEHTRQRISKQLELLDKDMEISRKGYLRDSLQYRQKLITLPEFERTQSNIINREYSLIGAISSYESSLSQINQYKMSIIDLEAQQIQEVQQFEANINRTFRELKNQLEAWKKTYIYLSPYAGTVTYARVWAENQYVGREEAIMTILPDAEGQIIAKMQIPVAGSAKIQVGNRVNIKLDNYPYAQFGVLKGTLNAISLVPYYDKFYYAEISLDGLISNYGKEIAINKEISGVASITVKDLTLFQRFLQPIRAIFKE